jgi:hypothetical protein
MNEVFEIREYFDENDKNKVTKSELLNVTKELEMINSMVLNSTDGNSDDVSYFVFRTFVNL